MTNDFEILQYWAKNFIVCINARMAAKITRTGFTYARWVDIILVTLEVYECVLDKSCFRPCLYLR